MGNRAKPSGLKELQGNPGKRRLNKSEPIVASGAPDMPMFLTDLARGEWIKITPILLRMNVLTIADGAALADYCMCFARWQEAEAAVTHYGVVFEEPILNKDGDQIGHRLKKNPAVTVANSCQKEMRAALSLFGLDPSSRSRIHVAPHEDKSTLEAILDGDDESVTVN